MNPLLFRVIFIPNSGQTLCINTVYRNHSKHGIYGYLMKQGREASSSTEATTGNPSRPNPNGTVIRQWECKRELKGVHLKPTGNTTAMEGYTLHKNHYSNSTQRSLMLFRTHGNQTQCGSNRCTVPEDSYVVQCCLPADTWETYAFRLSKPVALGQFRSHLQEQNTRLMTKTGICFSN